MIRRFSLYVCWCIFGPFLVIPIEAQTIKYISRSFVDSILNPKIQVEGERILRFEQKEHSIGVMSENEPPKSLNFSFRNVGTKAIKIQEVKTFCGCTSAVYDRQIIEPDSTGKIVVTYNPKNRVGTVDERIYIYTTDSNQTPIASLSILGEVKGESQWRHLPKKMGNLRLKRNFVDFMVDTSSSLVVERIWCGNSGDSPLKVVAKGLPYYMSFRMEPEILLPNEEGDMVIILDCKGLENTTNLDFPFFIEGVEEDLTKCMIKVKVGFIAN